MKPLDLLVCNPLIRPEVDHPVRAYLDCDTDSLTPDNLPVIRDPGELGA